MKKEMVSISLPLIELEDGKKPWDSESYSESGSYFVKDSSGIFHIVDVSTKKKDCVEWVLPANISNMIVAGLTVDHFSVPLAGMSGLIQEIHERLDRMNYNNQSEREQIVGTINSFTERNASELIDHVEARSNAIEEGVRTLMKLVDGIVSKSSSSNGNISEEALIEIVKTIRK